MSRRACVLFWIFGGVLTHSICRTKETFLYYDGKPDRWVRTGDEVMFNEDMEIFVLDRIKVRCLLYLLWVIC